MCAWYLVCLSYVSQRCIYIFTQRALDIPDRLLFYFICLLIWYALLCTFAFYLQVVEFNFLKAQAQEPLSTFLEYITYEYMIENIMMLLKGTLSGRDVNELIEQCHPMVRPTVCFPRRRCRWPVLLVDCPAEQRTWLRKTACCLRRLCSWLQVNR